MSVKLRFRKTLVLLNILEKKLYEIHIDELKPSGVPIVYTVQNCLWYLTISAGIGTKSRIRSLVNFMLGFGKNTTIGYWTIGAVKIWGII